MMSLQHLSNYLIVELNCKKASKDTSAQSSIRKSTKFIFQSCMKWTRWQMLRQKLRQLSSFLFLRIYLRVNSQILCVKIGISTDLLWFNVKRIWLFRFYENSWPGSNQLCTNNFKLLWVSKISLMIGMCHHCSQDKADLTYKDITLRGKEISILICKDCRELFTWLAYVQNVIPPGVDVITDEKNPEAVCEKCRVSQLDVRFDNIIFIVCHIRPWEMPMNR